jgi:transposase-like protein
MRNLTRVLDLLDEEPRVRLECPCSARRSYDSLAHAREDNLRIANHNPLLVSCPRCGQTYAGTVEYTTQNPPILTLMGSASAHQDVPEYPKGECPQCTASVYETHYQENSSHPEAGWSHYVCPSCENAVPAGFFDGG